MDMKQALEKIVEKTDLNAEQMGEIMTLIMTGQATPAQIGGFLIGLRMKGETVTEITAAAKVMRQLATPVPIDGSQVIDIVGTGGDGLQTFNISTASCFVAAAAGGKVAKHGNRSVSSKSGSADVLEAAGIKLDLTPLQIAECIEKIGVGFMFAPAHHGAMKHAISPRKEMGIRTLFNVLGPLTNPAGATRQLLGVFSRHWVIPLAEVLRNLGCEKALVVHAKDGMDEISLAAPTFVAEIDRDEILHYTISPEDFGLKTQSLETIKVENAQQSLEILRSVLQNHRGTARDIVQLNAGAALYVAGLANTLRGGIEMALDVLISGEAYHRFKSLIQLTHSFKSN
ncbi:MAG: anthranilate phosphoribosyltransferase [Pseudomonadota bacterium]|jgi:anthranilate phosphoribosyltransferase